MRVLVTGNLGYVGSILSPYLAQRQPTWSIEGFDSGFFAHCLASASPLPEVHLRNQFFGDLRDLQEDVLVGVDAVVLLGALSNDPLGDRFSDLTHEINLDSTLRIAAMARRAGVAKLVFASSCSIYGKGEGVARSEQDAVDPLTSYARSKVSAERGLKALATSDFQVVALRFATACGDSPRFRTDLVLNDFVRGAVVDGVIRILSDGTPWRPLIHVKDMARAVEWAITEGPADPFIALNTGSDSWNFQVHELASAVQGKFPAASIEMDGEAEPDQRSYRVDFSLFRRLAPSHQPAYSLDMAVEEMGSALIAARHGAQSGGYQFKRLAELQRLIASGFLNSDLRWG